MASGTQFLKGGKHDDAIDEYKKALETEQIEFELAKDITNMQIDPHISNIKVGGDTPGKILYPDSDHI